MNYSRSSSKKTVGNWTLAENCTINKNTLNFFVKMVHVDKFCGSRDANTHDHRSYEAPSRRDINASAHTNSQPEANSYLIPNDIVNNLPIWNHRKLSKTEQPHSQDTHYLKIKSRSPNTLHSGFKTQFRGAQDSSMRHRRLYTDYGNFRSREHSEPIRGATEPSNLR